MERMCSYNSIDGQPVSSDHEILTDVLRGQFRMPGFVRSDMTAVSRLYDWHFTAPSKPDASVRDWRRGWIFSSMILPMKNGRRESAA